MAVGSKNIFQSQTRQGPQAFVKKCKYLQGRIYSGRITRNSDCGPLLVQTKRRIKEIKQQAIIF